MNRDDFIVAEKKGLIGYLSAISSFYEFFQTIVGGNKTRKLFVKDFLKCEKNDKVLDFGAGTARILRDLPIVEYYAYEPKKSYHKKILLNSKFTDSKIKIIDNYSSLHEYKEFFNVIVLSGVIHHLDEQEFDKIANLLISLLTRNGKIITIDPVSSNDITFLNKFLNKIDRGNYIKEKQKFEILINNTFKLNTIFYYRDDFNSIFKFLQCISISLK